MYCKKYFYKNVQLILVAALFISTIAASGATPKNPIMPTINKTNPIDISHRVRDVYYSILFTINKKNGEIQNSFLIEKAQIIKELTNKLRIKGNVLLLNYPVPIFDKSSNVNQIFPPVNPTTAFTGYLDQLNARWLASSKVDFVIFDGSNVSNGQLLNDSPEFFKVLVCNFEVLYMNNDFLVLKPRNLEVCNTYKETLLDFPSDLIKNDIDEKFVYFKDSNLNSFLKNIQRIVWKENSILKVNGSSFYFKNGPKGTLVKIPNSLDLPDRYSLNGNVRNSIYFNYASIFG